LVDDVMIGAGFSLFWMMSLVIQLCLFCGSKLHWNSRL